ncbi:unnamed protein product [Brugia timori]|uniref:Very-long-chain 3-oxoacyl-CoA synthase n=1 Tax=Brugia timori TaxID=42155 RepID=A0A0R3QCC7_9BILA|nr:unnamed protein product [Brugia timori]
MTNHFFRNTSCWYFQWIALFEESIPWRIDPISVTKICHFLCFLISIFQYSIVFVYFIKRWSKRDDLTTNSPSFKD